MTNNIASELAKLHDIFLLNVLLFHAQISLRCSRNYMNIKKPSLGDGLWSGVVIVMSCSGGSVGSGLPLAELPFSKREVYRIV